MESIGILYTVSKILIALTLPTSLALSLSPVLIHPLPIMASSVRFLGVGRSIDGVVLATAGPNAVKDKFGSIISSTAWKDLQGSRLALEEESNVYVLYKDPLSGYAVGALVDSAYPTRVIYPSITDNSGGLLGELLSEAKNCTTVDLSDLQHASLQRKLQPVLNALQRKYADPSTIDKLSAVRAAVDDTTAIVRAGVEKAMANTERLEQMNTATEGLADTAGQFQRGTKTIRKKMQMRAYKVQCLIIVVVLAILAYIIIPLIP